MRPPLALAALAALAFVLPAGAVECKPYSFGPSELAKACGPSHSDVDCSGYRQAFASACVAIKDAAEDALYKLKALPTPAPEQLAEIQRQERIVESVKAAFADAVAASVAAQKLPPGNTAIQRFGALERVSDAHTLAFLSDFAVNTHYDPPEDTETVARNNTSPKQDDGRAAAAALIERDALKAPKPDPKQLAMAGKIFAGAGQAPQTDRVAKELIAADPSNPRGPNLAARAALMQNHPEAAAEWARKALGLDPANDEARRMLGYSESLVSKSRLKGPGAKPDFGGNAGAEDGSPRAGFAARPGPPAAAALPIVTPEAAPLNAPPHMTHARRKAAVGDYAGALADLTLALDQNPDDDAARLMRSEISLAMNNPDAALADADRVLAKRPDDPRALRAKASALLQLGRLEEALAAVEKAVSLEPSAAAGHLIRAQILEKLGRAADAAAEYREAARLDPALTPVAQEALRRLGLGPASSSSGPIQRRLLRGGMIAFSLALVLAGLVGGAAKLRTRRALAATEAERSEGTRTISTGDLVGGQYRVARELGRGGMGVVFEAIDETLKRPVALKQMQADMMTQEDSARFLQEARLVAQLKHPNIAEIHAAVDDGGLFLVFELVEGRTLDQVLAQGGVLPPDEVRRVVGDLCAALSCAHARRIVHRDLKPSNVMLAQDGRSKIMDFGIAHQARGAAATQTSASGTPPYMAPEQAMGSVLPASDLYALGVMAYELLAGSRPFIGPDFLGPKMRGDFNPISRLRPGLPPSLDAFFSAALSPDPSRRPADAASFRKAFDACWDASLPRTVAA